MQVKWLEQIHVALDYHIDNVEVCESSCYLLSVLLIVYPDLHCHIGDQENQ